MLKKLIKMNWDDLLLYLGVEGGLFLLAEIVIAVVMARTHPASAPVVMGVVLPFVAGFIALMAGMSHVGVSFDLALRFGQTRRRALGLILGLMFFEAVFGMALGGLLAAVERFLCPALWGKLAGNAQLNVETFSLDWYWWLLIFAAAVAGGIIFGAVLQRFGPKGGWIVWGVCMAPLILGQVLPWRTHVITDWLFPLLAVTFIAGFLWAVWSLLHAVVRS